MSTKKKRGEADDKEKKQPKKSAPNDDDDNDNEETDVEEEGDDEIEKVYVEEFLEEYQADKVGKSSDMQFFVTRLFESYASDSPLAGIYYTNKTMFPEMMIRLRKRIVNSNENNSNFNFSFNLKKKKILLELNPTVKFDPLLNIAARLTNDPDEILIFSLTDLVCLVATLKAQIETLLRVSTRKGGEVTMPIVESLLKKLKTVQANVISRLRASPGTMQSLKDSRLLFKGQPLSTVVENLEKVVKLYAPKNYDGGAVAIYFDFEDATISTVNAKHIEVPSVRQLDEGYELMRQHPTRVILLDMREHYKSGRPQK